MHKGNTSPDAHSAPSADAPTETDGLNDFATMVSRAYGRSVESARLMILQSVGAVSNRSVVLRGVEGIVCTAGFDLAIVTSQGDMIHGAQMNLLDVVLAELGKARERQTQHGRDATRHSYAALVSQLKEAKELLMKKEEQLQDATGREQYDLKEEVKVITKSLAAAQGELADWQFAAFPGIVRDGEGWEKFPSVGIDSFDGNFLQLSSATSLLQEHDALDPKWFSKAAALLRRSRQESPFSVTTRSPEGTTCSVQITGDPFAFSRLFHDPKFARTGFFSGFVLVEADMEKAQYDPEAMAEINESESWRNILADLLNMRLRGMHHRLHLDREGTQSCLDFRMWFTDFLSDVPETHHWSFSGWPTLLVEMAMGLAILGGQGGAEILEARSVRAAGELLKAHAPRQAALLDTLLPEEEVTDLFEERIERLVARLTAKGPLTKRDLARCISGQDYGVIDTLLKEAVRRGLIVQREKLFVATGVNVNASAGKTVIDFSRGVAA
jgi:hypothetical protein